MTSITLEKIYKEVSFLCEEDNPQTYWLQDYDGFKIEDDLGNVVKELPEDCICTILEDGRITIDGIIYQAYVSTKYKF